LIIYIIDKIIDIIICDNDVIIQLLPFVFSIMEIWRMFCPSSTASSHCSKISSHTMLREPWNTYRSMLMSSSKLFINNYSKQWKKSRFEWTIFSLGAYIIFSAKTVLLKLWCIIKPKGVYSWWMWEMHAKFYQKTCREETIWET